MWYEFRWSKWFYYVLHYFTHLNHLKGKDKVKNAPSFFYLMKICITNCLFLELTFHINRLRKHHALYTTKNYWALKVPFLIANVLIVKLDAGTYNEITISWYTFQLSLIDFNVQFFLVFADQWIKFSTPKRVLFLQKLLCFVLLCIAKRLFKSIFQGCGAWPHTANI